MATPLKPAANHAFESGNEALGPFIKSLLTRRVARGVVAIGCATGMAIEVAAQELPAPRATQVQAIGTYQGTRKGERVEKTYGGDLVEERTSCTLTMRFDPGGTMTYNAGRYFYQKSYGKRTTNGGYLKAVTTIESPGGQATLPSRLNVQLTQYGRVWGANWQPRVEIPGTVTLETWLTDGQGRVLQRTTKSSTRKLVYCDLYVNWRGPDQRGAGLPLAWQVNGRDSREPWIKVDVNWKLQAQR